METLSMDIWSEIFSHLIARNNFDLNNFGMEIRLHLVFLRRTSKHLHEICKTYSHRHPLPTNEDYSSAPDVFVVISHLKADFRAWSIGEKVEDDGTNTLA